MSFSSRCVQGSSLFHTGVQGRSMCRPGAEGSSLSCPAIQSSILSRPGVRGSRLSHPVPHAMPGPDRTRSLQPPKTNPEHWTQKRIHLSRPIPVGGHSSHPRSPHVEHGEQICFERSDRLLCCVVASISFVYAFSPVWDRLIS